MTESHRAVLARLADEFATMSRQMARVSSTLAELDLAELDLTEPAVPEPLSSERQVTVPIAPAPAPPPVAAPGPFAPPPGYPARPVGYVAPPAYLPPPVHAPPVPYGPPVGYAPPRPPAQPYPQARPAKDPAQGWIGKALAVAGVAVTLIGVVLLLVLAAQAGILRPELRVGAGAVLAGALVGVGARLQSRPGGRVGAIALAATGIAAAYMDIIAVTTIYQWVAAPVGLVVAAVVGGGGLTLARRWDSQHLAVLTLVPLIVLAPIVTEGIDLLLVGFMLALSAAALPVQLGKDWLGMHTARIAAATVPLLLALAAAHFGTSDNPWLLGGACAVATVLAIAGALLLLPSTKNRAALAVVTAAGTLPVLFAGVAVDKWLAAVLSATLSLCLLAIVTFSRGLPGIAGSVTQVFSALSAVSALIAVTVAFEGQVAAPVLLAMTIVVAIAARHYSAARPDIVARWAAIVFGVFGSMLFADFAPPEMLATATPLTVATGVSVLVTSALLAAAAFAVAWSWATPETDEQNARVLWAGAGAVLVYGITAFTVSAGVMIGGADGGFLAGHMAATICWIAMAAGLFVYALRAEHRDHRAAPIAGGLALTAAAMAKLFLFDLGTLDGIFRVLVFIVVGLILLAMGTGYARSLAARDEAPTAPPAGPPAAPPMTGVPHGFPAGPPTAAHGG